MHKIRTLFLSWDIEKSSLIALRCSDAQSRGQPRHRANLVILRDKNSVLILCIIVVAVFFPARVVRECKGALLCYSVIFVPVCCGEIKVAVHFLKWGTNNKGEVRRKMSFTYVLGSVVLRDVVKVFPVSSSSLARKTTGRNWAQSHSGAWRGLKTKWNLKLSLLSPTYLIRYSFI